MRFLVLTAALFSIAAPAQAASGSYTKKLQPFHSGKYTQQRWTAGITMPTSWIPSTYPSGKMLTKTTPGGCRMKVTFTLNGGPLSGTLRNYVEGDIRGNAEDVVDRYPLRQQKIFKKNRRIATSGLAGRLGTLDPASGWLSFYGIAAFQTTNRFGGQFGIFDVRVSGELDALSTCEQVDETELGTTVQGIVESFQIVR
jgi:hypothetical protein